MKNVHYQNDGLLLYIPTLSPESMHSGLMQGIIHTIKNSMAQEELPENVKQANIFLLDLLSIMIPEEQQIEQLYKH